MINRPGTASVCWTGRGFRSRKRAGPLFVLIALAALASCSADKISVRSLLGEMADFENLAESPRPFFKQAMASSYSRASHKGGEAWFDNFDRGEYVRAETLDGESFPSTFGTGTEDDYGMAYGYDRPVTCPYHAQTRVDGPGSGGHISLNRWYVLDALPYLHGVHFVQEMWHWMPCRPTWCYAIYWYAKPGTPGPQKIEESLLSPVDLEVRENMLDPFEGELLQYKTTGGKAAKERLANCSLAEHLVWRDARSGDRLTVHFVVPQAGRYSIELNLCMSPEYGRQRIFINGVASDQVIDCFSPKLYWLHPKLGLFDLKEGDNTLVAEALPPNPDAKPGNLFGLDHIFLVRQ